ncbi:acyclic terpene utilization AtuA family protein [Psychrobacter jeotgali]|uniref:acyclic terpene utilization AtuA family protein n=1 Tax=Psychrobacter jeotgali TaxID=179010 RepID=UPI001918D861|nr:acyclic terpene utilization AtuA family protein [Psychrobacter jeotgali]
MKSIRIGSGAGYSDDRLQPALDIIQYGEVDYIVFECLAERTIAIAQQRKMKNIKEGYDSLLEYRMEQVLPLCVEKNVKIVTNMGAANPEAAAERVKQIAQKQGLHNLKIAAVTGDDVLSRIDRYQDQKLLENNKHIKELGSAIVSANAYIGARGIVEALEAGADIIITGRAADPSLFLAPMIYEFGWSFADTELLGKGTIGGHLMECGAQITGGYFADPGYKEVPELWNVGFPIMEVDEKGDYYITKLNDSGGVVSLATVKEQLLYEIHDPANYLTPDVIADFSNVQVEEVEDNVVKVFGGSGKKKTGLLKTSIGYKEGYIAEAEISYGGSGSVKRARLAKEIIQKRLAAENIEPVEIRYDFIGLNSLYGNDIPNTQEMLEVRLRVAARAEDDVIAKAIVREVESLYTNGPAGGGGIRSNIKEIVSIGSILIPEADTDIKISYREVK